MKIEHFVFFPEVISKSTNEVSLYLNGLEDYENDDFNIFLAMQVLISLDVLKENIKGEYEQLLHKCLYENQIALPTIKYNGTLADEYTKNVAIMSEYRDKPDYRTYSKGIFEAFHFNADLPLSNEDLDVLREIVFELEKKNHNLFLQIQKEIKSIIKTTAWPRLPNNYFDYSLPATLIFETYKYDENLIAQLGVIAKNIIDNFTVEQIIRFEDIQEWKIVINLRS